MQRLLIVFVLEIGASYHYQARSVPVIRLQKDHEMIVVDNNDFMSEILTDLLVRLGKCNLLEKL